MENKDDKTIDQKTQSGDAPSMNHAHDDSQSTNGKSDAPQTVARDDRPWQEVIRERLGDISWERMSGSADKK